MCTVYCVNDCIIINRFGFFLNSSKKNACGANPGLPQGRQMKTPGLNLSLPILSPLCVQTFLFFTPGLFLNPSDPICNLPSCATLKDVSRAPGLSKTILFFFSGWLVKQCQPRLWASLDWLGKEVRQNAVYTLHRSSPQLLISETRITPKPLWCSLLSFFLTWPSRRVIN